LVSQYGQEKHGGIDKINFFPVCSIIRFRTFQVGQHEV
jgi:hypothetical protein